MIEKMIEVEAESLDEAREQLKSQMPKGFFVLFEDIISDGKHQSVKASGDTTEAALAIAQSNLPNNADILEQKELSTPEQKVITIEAFDEHLARSQARANQISENEVIKSIMLESSGSKGFLGIGKTPNRYNIEITREALVEITYKTKVKISAKIGKPEEQDITKLVKDIKNIWNGEEDQRAAANKLISYGSELAFDPIEKLLNDEEILVREIAVTSLNSISTELPETVIKSLEQATEKYEKDLDMIKQQIEPLIQLLLPLEGKYTITFSEYSEYKIIREIGEKINKIGGHSAMWIPCNHILHKNRSYGNNLEYCWDGIGSWQR